MARKKNYLWTFTIIISDKEPSTLLIPLVSVSAGELEREPLHPKRWENSNVGLPQSLVD